MTTAAKFPAATVTLANLLGEYPSIPANELTLNADITSGALSIVATGNIPSSWPQPGSLTIDSEVILYDSYTAATFTVNAAGRGTQIAYGAGAAAPHTAGATIGLYVSAQAMNQLLAEIIAIETQLLGGQSNPNLVLNSDFARRTVFGLAMPEVFADTSAWSAQSGVLGSVAGNILTAGTNNAAWRAAHGPGGVANFSIWRDGRWSATFKAVETAGQYAVEKYIDSNNYIRVDNNAGTFRLVKNVAGTPTVVASIAQAMTVNRWYWVELEVQGTTCIAKFYDTGGTASGVTKASSTLLQTLTGTISDAGVAAGDVALFANPVAVAPQWGGIATGNGGVCVETMLPESWAVSFLGTLGGQAIGYDESLNSGPIGKQNAMRVYMPASTRAMEIIFNNTGAPTMSGNLAPSTAYTQSLYFKGSGLGGNGAFRFRVEENGGATVDHDVLDAGETSWTRKTLSWASGVPNTNGFSSTIGINRVSATTGTFFIQLLQLEQGSAATAWRNAPADDGALKMQRAPTLAPAAITSVAKIEIDSRDLAVNLLLPWDAVVELLANIFVSNGTAGNQHFFDFTIDGLDPSNFGLAQTLTAPQQAIAGYFLNHAVPMQARLAAGKHRIALRAGSSAGTESFSSNPVPYFTITATRGK